MTPYTPFAGAFVSYPPPMVNAMLAGMMGIDEVTERAERAVQDGICPHDKSPLEVGQRVAQCRNCSFYFESQYPFAILN